MLSNIFSESALLQAWQTVKSKGSAPGIDGITINQFNENSRNFLAELKNDLVNGKYAPEPYERIFIKKESKKFRPIAILSVKDRIVQKCVYSFYEEKFNKIFIDTSYAYRKNKGHGKAVNRIQDFLLRGYSFAAAIDIDNFFDTIDRAKLFEKCRTYFDEPYIQKLIEMWTLTGVVYNENYIENSKGIAQGGVISPLLSNLYLHDFDLAMKNKNFFNVRYADNILIISKNREHAKSSLEYAENYLSNYLSLDLNERGKVIEAKDGFTFCGIFFKDRLRRIDSSKLDGITQKIQNLITSLPLEKLPQKLNDHLSGIERYYLPFDTKDQILTIEEILIDQLSKKVKIELKSKKPFEIKQTLKNINFISYKNFAQKDKIIKAILDKAFNRSNDAAPGVTPDIQSAVRYQKRRHQKIWFENLDLVISSNFSSIGKSTTNIAVRREGKLQQEISIKKIKNILIAAKGVTISSDAVSLCAENKIKIDYFDQLGKPYASIIPSTAPIFSLSNNQLNAYSSDKAKIFMSAIISAKVKNQINNIKYFIKNKKEVEEVFKLELNKMITLMADIENLSYSLDVDEFRNKVFGYEGSTAVSYWFLFRKLIPSEYEFESREHQRAENAVNMMLNYGYGILYTRILSAITIAGLNPNISYLHKEQKDKPSLVFDLIEQFRAPTVDRTVIAMLTKNARVTKKGNLLSDETKSAFSRRMLMRLNSEFKYRNKVTSFNKQFIEQAAHLAAFIKDEVKKYKPFITKW